MYDDVKKIATETQSLMALVGFHDELAASTLSIALELRGYAVDHARTPEEMIHLAQTRQYAAYLMDINLGSEGGATTTPAEKVYALVRARVESGQARFLGISGRKDVVDAAKSKGIPAMGKEKYDDLIAWLDR